MISWWYLRASSVWYMTQVVSSLTIFLHTSLTFSSTARDASTGKRRSLSYSLLNTRCAMLMAHSSLVTHCVTIDWILLMSACTSPVSGRAANDCPVPARVTAASKFAIVSVNRSRACCRVMVSTTAGFDSGLLATALLGAADFAPAMSGYSSSAFCGSAAPVAWPGRASLPGVVSPSWAALSSSREKSVYTRNWSWLSPPGLGRSGSGKRAGKRPHPRACGTCG